MVVIRPFQRKVHHDVTLLSIKAVMKWIARNSGNHHCTFWGYTPHPAKVLPGHLFLGGAEVAVKAVFGSMVTLSGNWDHCILHGKYFKFNNAVEDVIFNIIQFIVFVMCPLYFKWLFALEINDLVCPK